MDKSSTFIKLVAAGAALSVGGAQSVQAEPGIGGAYVGLGYGAFSGELGDSYLYGTPSGAPNGFVGYNFVNGDIVYGAELTMWADSTYEAYGGPYGYSSLVDVKARVGKTFGNTLAYGTLGYFQTDYSYYDADYYGGTAKGWSVGLGFETEFSGNSFVGADVTHRTATSDSGQDGPKFGGPLTTVAVRAGLRF